MVVLPQRNDRKILSTECIATRSKPMKIFDEAQFLKLRCPFLLLASNFVIALQTSSSSIYLLMWVNNFRDYKNAHCNPPLSVFSESLKSIGYCLIILSEVRNTKMWLKYKILPSDFYLIAFTPLTMNFNVVFVISLVCIVALSPTLLTATAAAINDNWNVNFPAPFSIIFVIFFCFFIPFTHHITIEITLACIWT